MTLPSDGLVSILPLDKFQPQGTPIGQHAFFLKMTPEALEQLSIQVASQQEATAREIEELKRHNGRYAPDIGKKNQKPLMQLVVGENGQPTFRIGTQVFKADAVDEKATCEIYARHPSPASDSGRRSPNHSAVPSLQMVAKVDGRINIKREYVPSVQQAMSERTARLNKEAQPRSAIIPDAPNGTSASTSRPPSRTQQVNSATLAKHVVHPPTASRPVEAKGQVALTPPKSDGSPSYVSSSPRGPKHHIPDSFASLNLTIPSQWDRNVPIPIRIIHHLALKPKAQNELLTEINLAAEAERQEATQAIDILCERQSDGSLRLRDEAFYYLRPWCWVHYSLQNRTEVSKHARVALRKLGYDDSDEAWEHLRRQSGWVDPWRNTPEGAVYYREKEEKKSKGDHEKRKAEALANPAPMLTSNIKPGFFSSNADNKGKKASKEKEPKVKKDKAAGKKDMEKDSGAQPRMAQSGGQSSSTGSSIPSAEPSIQDVELRIRQSGPGSAGGKLAVAKRLQREKEEGRGSTVSTPTRSPLPLSTPESSRASTSKADLKKRKVEDDDYQEGASKKRKAGSMSTVSVHSDSIINASATKKRKGDDNEALSPPSKMRKADAASSAPASMNSQKGSISSATGLAKKIAASRKASSATRDYNGRKSNGRESWDYSDNEDTTPPPKSYSQSVKKEERRSQNTPSPRSALPTPHPVAPPTTYMGFKAVYMQKWSQYSMFTGMLMGEQAKLANLRPGDDAATLMTLDEIKSLLRKRQGLEADLKELKAEIARLTPKGV